MLKKILGFAGQKGFEYVKPVIAKNLSKLRKIKEEGFKAVDDQTKGTNVSNQKKAEIKKSFGKKISNIINPEKKAKGGRVGLSKGSGFPDYSGDGKITMKDVLMGRGVIPKKKGKKKMMAKKTETPMQKAVKKNKNKKRII